MPIDVVEPSLVLGVRACTQTNKLDLSLLNLFLELDKSAELN